MIPQNQLILLDTCILVHLVRGQAPGQWIDTTYQLRNRPLKPLISIVTVGEMYSLVGRLAWGDAKLKLLETLLLKELVIVDLNFQICRRYAEIDRFLNDSGQKKEKNDLWIAATASVANARLLTNDTDFDPLHPHWVDREYIDPQKLPRG